MDHFHEKVPVLEAGFVPRGTQQMIQFNTDNNACRSMNVQLFYQWETFYIIKFRLWFLKKVIAKKLK